MNFHRHLLALMLLISTCNGEDYQEYEHEFRIGVGVDPGQLSKAVCTPGENEFIEQTLASFIVNLARMFFMDETVRILDDGFFETDPMSIDPLAFKDFNTYEMKKFQQDPKENVVLVEPRATFAPSQAPSIRTMPPSHSPTMNCNQDCKVVDFERYPDGSKVKRGDYVSDEWRSKYGFSLAVDGIGVEAFTPLNQRNKLKQGRIFDTSNPTDKLLFFTTGDDDLGSPNHRCTGGGPGVGSGGMPGHNGENCTPLGNVLIIQQFFIATPDDNRKGGTFTFKFDDPVYFKSIGLLDVSSVTSGTITAIMADGESETFLISKLGSNSVQTVSIKRNDVVKVKVYIPESAAVTELRFCNACTGSADIRRLQTRNHDMHMDDITFIGNQDLSRQQEHIQQRSLSRELWNASYFANYARAAKFGCRYCGGDTQDNRAVRHNLRALGEGNDNNDNKGNGVNKGNLRNKNKTAQGWLVSGFETLVSYGLTVNFSSAYRDWLLKSDLKYGCLGDGLTSKVVFELVLDR